jgi:putative oxidoreductase
MIFKVKEVGIMCKEIFRTKDDIVGFLLRICLGAVFFPHGAQKALGWFGGYGLKATLAAFNDKMHIPAALAILVVIFEFLGSICLVLGLATRVAATGIAVIMVVAVKMGHFQNGFFMNWAGTQKGEGYEYHILVFAICLALIIKGGGWLSIDKWISGKKNR